MSFARKIFALATPVALLALSGCATGLPTRVSRFQQLPVPAGQTFFIEAADERNRGGIEFARYADLVSQAMTAQGYRPAGSPAQANLRVSLDYGVDNGTSQVRSNGGFGGGFGFGRGGFGRGFGGYGGRFGRGNYIYGFNDPFLYGNFGGYGGGFNDISSYTVFTSFLDLDIRTPDGRSVFEGLVRARSRNDRLTDLVPDLVEAMFTDFPGRSGETVEITVRPPERDRRGRR